MKKSLPVAAFFSQRPSAVFSTNGNPALELRSGPCGCSTMGWVSCGIAMWWRGLSQICSALQASAIAAHLQWDLQ